MKKILSILTIFTASFAVNAQNVTIPDANFKAYLVGNTAINTNGDTEIQVSEASAFTGTIYCSNLSISNMTGLQAFTSLTNLGCDNNLMTTLDVSANTALTTLNCSGTLMTSLDISQNTSLTTLVCTYSALTSLTASPSLIDLNCANSSSLATLNVSQGTSLTIIKCQYSSVVSLDVSQNSALTELHCYDNSLTTLNVANGANANLIYFFAYDNPGLTCITVDDVAYSTTNWVGSNYVFDATSSFSTNCGGPCTVNIPDANFKAYLVGNTAINTNGDTEIQCSEASAFSGPMNCNSLSISDLTGIAAFTSLTNLACNNNLLTSLDVSALNSLTLLYCNDNQISSIDVSALSSLTHFYCHGNQIATLSTTNNAQLTHLRCFDNLLTSLDVTSNSALTTLYCYDNQISSLDLSQNLLLEELKVSNNNLTSLDVTLNTVLEELQFEDNQISIIDVSQNTLLERIFCRNTALTVLDCSNNAVLYWIVVNNNNLQTLDVSNGNNTNVAFFWAHNNPNLTCIEVDDVTYSNANWTSSSFDFDAVSSFSTNCVGAVLVNSITVQGQGGVSTITTQGGTLQMEATVLPANADDATYTWSVVPGSGSANISTSGLLTATTNGTVDVVATANDGSGITGMSTVTISNQTVGLDEASISNLKVYPNPVQNELSIELEGQQITEIKILDLSGKVVKVIANDVNSIDVSSLTEGVYILKVSTATGIATSRFIKQ